MTTVLFIIEVVAYLAVIHVILYHYYYTTNNHDIVTKIRISTHLTMYNFIIILAGYFYFMGMVLAFCLQFFMIFGTAVVSAIYKDR